jgi:hypothetical protein
MELLMRLRINGSADCSGIEYQLQIKEKSKRIALVGIIINTAMAFENSCKKDRLNKHPK